MERNVDGASVGLGAATIGAMEEVYAEYVEKYGQDNADYLMEVMGEWAALRPRRIIDMGGADGRPTSRWRVTKQRGAAGRLSGGRATSPVDDAGAWRVAARRFLVVPPAIASGSLAAAG